MAAENQRARAGILDVAERAGVSRQTVTRAMNDMPGISAETKHRVLEAARDLRYRPSRFGRGLVTRGTKTLGLVVADLTNGFWAELASCMLDEAADLGWTVLIAEASHDPRVAIGKLLEHVDGVFGLIELPEADIDSLVGPTPLLLLDPPAAATDRAGITLEFGHAMVAVVDHLVERGHARPVMLDWSRSVEPSRRAAAFAHAARLRGLEPLILHTHAAGEPVIVSGREAAAAALARWPDLNALVCFNDLVAVGAMKGLQAWGRVVPSDVSVVGIDGSAIGRVVSPELTTLRFDLRVVAHQALSAIIEILEGSRPERGLSSQWHVSPELEVRASS